MDMEASEVIALLKETEAFQSGHFLLCSGMHSSQYVQCALLLQHPAHSATVGSALAGRFRALRPPVVIGPASGGLIIAHDVAPALGCRALFDWRVEGKIEFR